MLNFVPGFYFLGDFNIMANTIYNKIMNGLLNSLIILSTFANNKLN